MTESKSRKVFVEYKSAGIQDVSVVCKIFLRLDIKFS